MERLREILIDPKITIKQALKQMDETAKKILFVVDSNNGLLGTVTDGDVRRWILRNGDLNENLSEVMNKNPIFLHDGSSKEEAKNLMVLKKIECIPIVDEHKRIVSAIWWADLFDHKFNQSQSLNIPVVIMAGGEGMRLAPFTKILPKPLMLIGEKPILEVIIDKFMEYGCKEFYLSVNYKANIIKAYFMDIEHDYEINYIQEEKPLGTAGSLYLLKKKIYTTFFVSNCDILIEADYADILEFHRQNKNKITLVGAVKHYIIPYGVCDIGDGGNMKEIKEKPEYNFLVNTGMYVLEPETLEDIPENTFYHITDLINNYKEKGDKIGVYPISEKSWLDMGQWEELQDILKKFGAK